MIALQYNSITLYPILGKQNTYSTDAIVNQSFLKKAMRFMHLMYEYLTLM